MFKDMKLSTKLLVTFLLIGIIPVAACAWVAIAKSSAALSKQSYGQLEAIRAIKASQIQDYFKAMRTQLKVLKGDAYIRKALVEMDAAFEASGKKTDTPEWQDQAARYDARLKGIMEGYGWYDIFLIHDDGDIVYTVTREPDLGMVIPESKLRDEGLGKAFTRAHAMGNDDIAMSDFSPYSPSNGAPAAFMMARIADPSGKLLGFIAFQVPLDHINAIMKQRDGMGETGESYLVGPDKLMRSDSFLDPVHHTVKASFADPSKGSVNTEAVTEALAGKTDQKIVLDYNGNPVLSAYMPLDVGGVTWALLVDIDESEAFAAVTAMEWIMGVIAVVSIVIILVVAWLVTRSVTVPITRAIGELNTGADQVASAATQVSSSSQTLAQGSSEQAASIEETSSSLEEMSAMTKQNASNAGEADSLMRDANQVVDEANGSMTELTTAMNGIEKASEETSKIIKTIDEIAFQTNLLALNAAVEAARAGEAGAGFAVVADEVRNLAMRAADAAKNTAELIEGTVKQIGDGNTLVGRTSEAFGRVSDSAGKVGELVSEIAAASSEQSQGISQVNTAVTEMEKVTQQNAASAEESASAAEEMTAQAEQMKAVVNQLVGLIHGRAQQPGSVAPRAKRSAPAKRPQKALAPAPAVTAPAVQSTAAEKLIPLDDDDSFSDF